MPSELSPSTLRRFHNWCAAATTQRRIHGWATVVSLAIAAPAVLVWRDSVTFLVFVSVYSAVTGHWSSWQASRIEVKQEAAEESALADALPTLVIPATSATTDS